jgi:hypothetical protein
MSRHRRTRLLAVLGLILACAACTGQAETASEDPGTSTEPPSAVVAPATSTPVVTLRRADAPVEITVEQVRGRFPGVKRTVIAKAIAAPVSAWFDNAFLDVAYPATDFAAAFASWTPGSRNQSRRDRDVTTNKALGHRLAAVAADRRQINLSIFGSRGEFGGATARVRLELTGQRLAGPPRIHVKVWGDLYLTPGDDGWRIFGYDLHRSVLHR